MVHRPTTIISNKEGPPPRAGRWPLEGSVVAGASVPVVLVADAAAGAGSVVIKMIWFLLASSVQVLARDLVRTLCSTSKLVGLFSLMIVNVPSPWELNASMV